jgi:chromatin assembly factor 1 subunit B
MPYRYIYAVATEDSIFFYDTQSLNPFAYVTDIHYSNLSDLSWSNDARFLLVTSIDGFCTFISFKDGELGKIYSEPNNIVEVVTTTTTTTVVVTPLSTANVETTPLQQVLAN